MTYRHIVLFRVHDGVSASAVEDVVGRLRSLESLPGVLSWRIERSLDTRKGMILVEEAVFVDQASFEAFRSHADHRSAAEAASRIADWWIGDYLID